MKKFIVSLGLFTVVACMAGFPVHADLPASPGFVPPMYEPVPLPNGGALLRFQVVSNLGSDGRFFTSPDTQCTDWPNDDARKMIIGDSLARNLENQGDGTMFSGQTYDGGNVTFRSKRRTSSIADLSGALTLSPGTAASLGLRTRILGISFDLYALSNVLYFGTIYLVTTKDGFGHCHGIRFDVVPGQTAELDQPKPQASTVDSGAGLKEVQTNDQGGALEKKEIAAPVLPAN